jgi:uncharacterized alkaline shock family protein YloU
MNHKEHTMAQKSQTDTGTTATTFPAPTLAVATGKTTIVDPVIAKIVGLAAREVPGVFALGGGAARIVGSIRDAIGTSDLSQGIKVEVGETQVAADVTIVVEYPLPLQQVADGVRAAVAAAINELIGMEVAEINVTVTDVHIPSDDENEPAPEARVA